MSSDLDALYQEIILEHNRRPKNFGELPNADAQVAGRNPLCGDEITLWVDFDGERIADVKFVGTGCAVSKASASMMTQAIKGKTREEAAAMFDRIHELVVGKLPEEERRQLGQLAALGGVSKFPIRVKCASLAWHALRQALSGEGQQPGVSTE